MTKTAWRYEIKYGPEGEANYAWVYDTAGDMVCTAKTHHAEAIVARMNTTASLQGEEAVERVARLKGYADRIRWCLDNEPQSVRFANEMFKNARGMMEAIDAILATGLVQDEAAIRADEREKQRERDALVADEHASSYDNEWNRKLGKSNDLVEACEDIAAAIRSGGGE